MSKVVTLNAKDALGKDYPVIDSFENVKKTSKGLIAMLNAMDEVETHFCQSMPLLLTNILLRM